jgi:RNA polymerase-binding transcription factor DksA
VTDAAEQPDVRDAPGTSRTDATPAAQVSPVDLDDVERDLAAVERALERLSEGSYWTDEVTGEPIPDHILVADPTARRA